MHDRTSRRPTAPRRKFTPALTPLENRALLSTGVSGELGRASQRLDQSHALVRSSLVPAADAKASKSSVPPFFKLICPCDLCYIGGISAQVGSILYIGVGKEGSNFLQVDQQGAGAYQSEWDGRPVHAFTGVAQVKIIANHAPQNQILFNLNGSATPAAVVFRPGAPTAAATTAGAHPLAHSQRVELRRTGVATQSGTVLTLAVDKPSGNKVLINEIGQGAVRVEWNGGKAHSFSDVATVVVDTRTRPPANLPAKALDRDSAPNRIIFSAPE